VRVGRERGPDRLCPSPTARGVAPHSTRRTARPATPSAAPSARTPSPSRTRACTGSRRNAPMTRASAPAGTTGRGARTPRRADGAKAALVSLDLISTTRQVVTEARREIERTTGVPGAAVMVSATHSHTGPVLNTRGPRENALGGASDLAQRYTAELPAKIAEA